MSSDPTPPTAEELRIEELRAEYNAIAEQIADSGVDIKLVTSVLLASDLAALARLLIDKGIITQEEYLTATIQAAAEVRDDLLSSL